MTVRVRCFDIYLDKDDELLKWAETLYHVQFELSSHGDTWLIFDNDEDATVFKLKFGHLLKL